MTDKELLGLAAKAPGVDQLIDDACDCRRERWNPLEDDGDAMRLAIELSMRVSMVPAGSETWVTGEHCSWVIEPWSDDKKAATRRAIVRAAAQIGAQM